MANTLYDYDCMIQNRKNERFYKGISVWTKLKDKVSLATAWFNNNQHNIDWTSASSGHMPYIHSDSEIKAVCVGKKKIVKNDVLRSH